MEIIQSSLLKYVRQKINYSSRAPHCLVLSYDIKGATCSYRIHANINVAHTKLVCQVKYV